MKKKDELVKRIWLLILILSTVFYLAPLFVSFFYFERSVPSGTSKAVFEKISSFQNGIILTFLWMLLKAPFMYFFSYKKKGIILLNLSILGSVIALAITIFSFPALYALYRFNQGPYLLEAKWVKSFIMFLILVNVSSCVIDTLWAFFCYKVRLINIKQRFDDLLSNDSYRVIFDDLNKISELGQLEDFYREQVQKYPAIEMFLTRKYKQRRKEIKCT